MQDRDQWKRSLIRLWNHLLKHKNKFLIMSMDEYWKASLWKRERINVSVTCLGEGREKEIVWCVACKGLQRQIPVSLCSFCSVTTSKDGMLQIQLLRKSSKVMHEFLPPLTPSSLCVWVSVGVCVCVLYVFVWESVPVIVCVCVSLSQCVCVSLSLSQWVCVSLSQCVCVCVFLSVYVYNHPE